MNLKDILFPGRAPAPAAAHRFVTRGDRARDARDWPAAAKNYERALGCDENLPHIWVQYGHALKESGNRSAALEAYRKSIALDPGVSDTYLQTGHVTKLLGQLPRAAGYYRKALEVDVLSRDAALELRELLKQKISIDRAVLGEPIAEAHESRPKAANIVFEVSDLIEYFKLRRLPTGVQRVQIEVVTNALMTAKCDVNIFVCCFAANLGGWREIPRRVFLKLCEIARAEGDKEAKDWLAARGAVDAIIESESDFVFPRGAFLVNVGTSWMPNYLLSVRNAKKTYGIRYTPFVHDVLPAIAPEFFVRRGVQNYVGWAAGVFQHADGFFVNSEATKAGLLSVAQMLGHDVAEIHVVRLDASFGSTDADRPEHEPLDREPFVLFVATIEPRKNHLMAFSAWLDLIDWRGLEGTPKLVCVGHKGWLYDEALACVENNRELKEKVLFLEGMSDTAIARLYSDCLFTIYPSLNEGWGLPVTESLCRGKVPVVARASSLPEAGGEFAEYFDPNVQGSFARKIERLIGDEAYRIGREREIARRFRPRAWTDISQEILSTLIEWNGAPGHVNGSSPAAANGTPPLVDPGRYYPLWRNRSVSVWSGMGTAELFRDGAGWGTPEDWGCRARGQAAHLVFRVPASAAPMCFHIGLRGAGKESGYRIEHGARTWLSGSLAAGETRWLTIPLELPTSPDQALTLAIVNEAIEGGASRHVKQPAQSERVRVAHDRAIGVIGFMVCEENDKVSRTRLIEAIAFNDFDEISGRPRDG